MVIRPFDVFANPSRDSRDAAPFVVLLQSEHAGNLPTIVVAPLYHMAAAQLLTQLAVAVPLDGEDFIVSVPELLAMNSRRLRRKAGDLLDHEYTIRRALDRLFTGF